MVTAILDCPCVPELGLTLVIVGAGLPAPASTVKPLVSVALWPSVLVTVTLRVPVVAVDWILMLAVIFVAELNVQELTVMPAPKAQVGEARKFVPVSTTLRFEAPWLPEVGLREANVGAGAEPTVMIRVSGL